MVERGFPVLVWVYFNDKSLMVAVFLFVCVCSCRFLLVCFFSRASVITLYCFLIVSATLFRLLLSEKESGGN
jgi:hypothetical protein